MFVYLSGGAERNKEYYNEKMFPSWGMPMNSDLKKALIESNVSAFEAVPDSAVSASAVVSVSGSSPPAPASSSWLLLLLLLPLHMS